MIDFLYDGEGLYVSANGTSAPDGEFYRASGPYWPQYAIKKQGSQYLVGRHADGEYAVFAVATSLAKAKALVGEEVQP